MPVGLLALAAENVIGKTEQIPRPARPDITPAEPAKQEQRRHQQPSGISPFSRLDDFAPVVEQRVYNVFHGIQANVCDIIVKMKTAAARSRRVQRPETWVFDIDQTIR